MGCLDRQKRKSQPEINKSIEGNQCQEDYHRTQVPFVCQPNAPNVKENATRINWPRSNDNKWKALDEELSFILQNNLKGTIGVKLHSFTKIAHSVCIDHFGVAKSKENTVRTANRRQREKGRLRAEQRLLKKRLKEIPEDRVLVRKQLSEVKGRILAISRAENARKRRQKKRKARRDFGKNPFKFTKKLFEVEKNGVLNVPKEDLEAHLREKYTDPLTNIPLGHLNELNRPHPPAEKFDNSPLKLGEIRDFVKKARAKSSPGINGISYKLYKRCPNVLTLLWRLLRKAHIKKFIAEDWGLADGIHIPKEKDSKRLDQFRPISLLNVEGKIFFGVIAKRMTTFILNNAYVNTSIQKAGIPGFPGCIEHTTMLWDAIKTAKNDKSAELHVIWLDLENAYGSVRHQLLEKAMEFFWIPEDIRNLISAYFKCTYMRFSNNKYSTNWQKLNIGIMMGCVISPLLFVLVMEMILRNAESNTNKKTVPSMKAFMDDVTLVAESRSHMKQLMNRLQELFKWAAMKIKPSKCRSLSIMKGICKEVRFFVDGNEIPTIREKSVKSLGRCYSLPITDRHRWQDIIKQLKDGLRSIDKCDLINKDKIWCIYFGLIPKLSWPMQIYEVSLTRVEKMERLISNYVKKWLGVPNSLTNVALYSSSTKLKLPMVSLVEKFKLGKARLFQMLRDSRDPLVKNAQPSVITGRKWKAQQAVENAESSLKMKEIIGTVAKGRSGLGLHPQRWWSKESKSNKRIMISEEIHQLEEVKRIATAVGQSKQGAWTRWESAKERVVTWSDIRHMEPKKLSFLIKAVYDILPTPVNLHVWGLATSDLCKACGKTASLKHILTGCEYALRSYTWRHNEVLEIVAEASKIGCETANKAVGNINKAIYFVKEGNISKFSRKNRHVSSIFDGSAGWRIACDLEHQLVFPTEITLTAQRPDIVIWSVNQKKVFIVELTVPFEENLDWAHQRKLEKYEDLREQCVRNGWITNVFPIEVGCRGFITNSTSAFLSKLGLSPPDKRKYLKKIQEKALTASAWIWQSYIVTSNRQSLVVS